MPAEEKRAEGLALAVGNAPEDRMVQGKPTCRFSSGSNDDKILQSCGPLKLRKSSIVRRREYTQTKDCGTTVWSRKSIHERRERHGIKTDA
jgi:hypothetical protein